jgi:ankyrin repeat protein
MFCDNVVWNPNALNVAGMPILNDSIHNGKVEDVKKLLDQGADVNQVGESGTTALCAAIQRGNLVVVRLVLNHGANVNQVDKNGITALATALHHGNLAVVQMVLQYGAFVNQVALVAEIVGMQVLQSLPSNNLYAQGNSRLQNYFSNMVGMLRIGNLINQCFAPNATWQISSMRRKKRVLLHEKGI